MLLLMVEPQGDQLGQTGLTGVADEGVHCLVDELAVARDLVDPRTGQETTFGPGMTGADSLVVGVEDVGVGLVEGAVSGGVFPEDERLEEPRHVGPVPFRRAYVGHGLDRLVLGTQHRGQPLCRGPDPAIGARELGRRFSTAHIHGIRPFATPPGAVAHTGSVPVHPTQGCSPSGAIVATFHANARWVRSGNPHDRAAEGTPASWSMASPTLAAWWETGSRVTRSTPTWPASTGCAGSSVGRNSPRFWGEPSVVARLHGGWYGGACGARRRVAPPAADRRRAGWSRAP